MDIPKELLRRAQRAEISTKAGRVSTNRLLARWRHLYSWSIAEKGFLETSPFAKGGVSVVKLDTKAEGPRSRRLNDDEEALLLQHAGSHLRACIEATLESGSRLLEAPGVSLADVGDFLGHRDVSQTNTYLASTTLRLRDALRKRDAARTNLAQAATDKNGRPEGAAVTH